MDRYDPSAIEPKWQAYWDQNETFATPEEPGEKRTYILDMFPYPSGSGLHVGHPEGYTATDILARFKRANGYDVLHPMGWDAFGLPAEQYAIQTGTHPATTTAKNIDTFRRQLKMLGFSYDWSREVNTTDPEYVRWTQWIFLQLFKQGLAYQSEIKVNWCPALGTVLANEEVIDGLSERGQHPVVRTPLRQWMLKITQYADRLLDGLADVDWPNSTRTQQAEWIGRSVGAEVEFAVEGQAEPLTVFTTRPDTLFGATFMVVAPEHPMVLGITTDPQRDAVTAYAAKAKNKSDLDRKAAKQKTGVFTGGYAINPVNNARVPIYVADYVLMDYGTGAIMAVPAHDVRDFEFATTHGIEIIEVVSQSGEPSGEPLTEAMVELGVAVNSGDYDGLESAAFKEKIAADLEAQGKGRAKVQYKLRDWVFSRQRYWGEPFPIYFPVTCDGDPRKDDPHTIHFDQPIAVEESELPVRLPELDDYQPGDDPAGVLARAKDWRFFQKDGAWFARETNNMPQWAGSCWYYLRYLDPHNQEMAFSEDAQKWLPVDLYVGGNEHAVLHLLYARFWHMVLYDQGHVKTPEPFKKLVHQGMILGEIEYTSYEGENGFVSRQYAKPTDDKKAHFDVRDKSPLTAKSLAFEQVKKLKGGEFALAEDPTIVVDARAHKMSKSRGNVVNPDAIVKQFGADSLRVYEMFMGPLTATKPWNTASISGVRRFLDRSFTLAKSASDKPLSDELKRSVHKTIKKVGADIEALRFNTAISAMMVLSTELQKAGAPREGVAILAQLVHPFAPHLGEEMWELLGHAPSVQNAPWPEYDEALTIDATVNVPVQVNGKKKGVLSLPKDASQEDALAAAKELPTVAEMLEKGQIRKTIFVPGRILNLVVK